MASPKRQHRRENHFIYDLPYSITRQICCNLDVDRAWEKLASEIGYTIQEVRVFEMAFQHHSGSPCKDVLSDWGSKNATAKDLYLILQRIGRRREMQLLESYFNCDSKQNKIAFQTDQMSCHGMETPSMILRALDNSSLPPPPSKSSTKASVGAWSTSSMNGSTSMSDKNVNLNMPENPKGKATKKHAEYKAIPSLTDEQFYPQKKHDYLGIMKETSGLSSTSTSSFDSKSSMSGVKVNQCEMDGPAQEKGDMDEKPLDSSLMETLKNKDGYSSLAKEGGCDIDVAVALVGTQSFTTKELNHATNGFSEEYKIGEGAFGEVFKGFLKRTHCAIKKLFSRQEEGISHQDHLTSELKSLIKYRHENIVPLYGYTFEEGETCLVYQFMQNGSLEDRLRCTNNTRPLDWHQRLEIMKGAACGLQYLHTLDQKPLIHGDIKSSNILLDKHLEAKIADLGLARHATGGSSQSGRLTHITKKQTFTKQYQTKAYLPPEVIRGNAMSIKGDTYSFGVVMLEVFTGESAYDENREGGQFLKDYVKDFSDTEEKWLNLFEKGLQFTSKDVIKQFFKLALQCISQLKKSRPDMVEVHTNLSNLEASINKEFPTTCSGIDEIHIEHLPSEAMSDLGTPQESPFTSNENQPEHIPHQIPTYPVIKMGQPITEAMKLQLEYDSGLKQGEFGILKTQTAYESDPLQMEEKDMQCSSEFQNHEYMYTENKGTDLTKKDFVCSHDVPTNSSVYPTDINKLEDIKKIGENLDISSTQQDEPHSDEQQNEGTESGFMTSNETETTVSDIKNMALTDTISHDYQTSTVTSQSEFSFYDTNPEITAKANLPGGNQERLAQEIAAVGEKSGFGSLSLFEKYKEALDMEHEEDYDTGESVEYDGDYNIITGVSENDDSAYYWDPEEEEQSQEDTFTTQTAEQDDDQIETLQDAEVQRQGPVNIHFCPSSPAEATEEEDYGDNDSRLFSSQVSEEPQTNIVTDKYQKDLTPHLGFNEVFCEEDTMDQMLFENPKNSASQFTSTIPSVSTENMRTFSPVAANGCESEKDVKLLKVNSNTHWQHQRLEPSEGECFV